LIFQHGLRAKVTGRWFEDHFMLAFCLKDILAAGSSLLKQSSLPLIKIIIICLQHPAKEGMKRRLEAM